MRRFYVYELIDPRDLTVFYVGKGQRSRINQHEIDAFKGKQSAKCDRIREIQRAGLVVSKRIVRRFTRESAAYRFEAKLIHQHGIGQLTNVAPGGNGMRSLPATVIREREIIALAENPTFHKGLRYLGCQRKPIGRKERGLAGMVLRAFTTAAPNLVAEIFRSAEAKRRLESHGFKFV